MSSVPGARGPRPLAAFFISLVGSAVLLGALLLTDRRVFELAESRERVKQLDAAIEVQQHQNGLLQSEIDAANRHEFPAERVAREELHLVDPSDLVLLYPPGSLSPAAPRAPAPPR